jgi:hypothetical protein
MAVLFLIFTISEWMMRARRHDKGLEQFNLDIRSDISAGNLNIRPGCVLVAVRDSRRMQHLQAVLEKTNTRRHDILVMTIRGISKVGAGEYELSPNQLFTSYEQKLYSKVVSMAEKQGKPVELMVVPGVNPFDAMVQTASRLKASRLVTGVSARMDSEELARRIGRAWERLPEPRQPFSLEIISGDRPSIYVNLGPHPPRLWPGDIDLAHKMWLQLSEKYGARLHHRDVVGVALRRMQRDMENAGRRGVLADIEDELSHRAPQPPPNEAEGSADKSKPPAV